jgi:hypothetical protein
MPKQKSSAQIHVADGAGGMRQVTDFRFETGEWPIALVVPAKDAETWMAHLNAEMEERGWNSSSFSQLDAVENSGTLSVHTANGPSPATLDIVWERPRGKELQLRARPSGDPVLSLDVAHDFINAVGARVCTGKVLCAHRQALLTYDGLPWRGELWLDDNHRLGPPSKHPDSLLGPQILIVDAMIEGIGQRGVTANFQKRIHELRIFLGFVLGLRLEMSKSEQDWVCDVDAEGRFTDCKLRNIGYVELSPQAAFPKLGCTLPVVRRDVARPGLGPYGITSDMHEEWVPGDIEQLWRSFMALPPPKRDHLLRAGNAYLTAQLMWPDQRTAYAAFLVVACEALKPTGRTGHLMNVYDVVASLVSSNEAQNLRQLTFHPQQVRSKHLHRGELVAGELLPMLFDDHFRDPSFDEMLRILSSISRVCLIEWLRLGGNYKVVRMPREKHRPKAGPTSRAVSRSAKR